MEDLLTPQICMDIDDTPLDVGKDETSDEDRNSESGEPEMDDDEKVKRLLELQFTGSAQVPDELTDFEKDAKKNVFAIGEPAVQFQRLHCTACNLHLGSAPIGHFNRYIHPLLKVLLCKPCYEFYCSGEFDKDEDGSEMYCRWCGQGGKVMCCAQCAYVFCQKCVRQNLGKRTLELIKDSDDWLCFGCNPTQLINLKIICTSLFDFMVEEIRLSKSLNNIERLKVDHSVCCQKVKASKRKRGEDDVPYRSNANEREEHKAKKPNILKSALNRSFAALTENSTPTKTWNQREEAEVLCTPDLPLLMDDDMPALKSTPQSAQTNNTTGMNPILSGELNKAPLNAKEPVAILPKSTRPEGKKLYTIAPKTNMMMINMNNLQKPGQNFIRLQAPTVKYIPTMTRAPVANSLPSQITPGTKHEWYDKAASVVSTINSSLSATLMNLTKEQKNARTVEQLANIHNKLQELLSSSVNSLIQVRKNLRTEFLADLNKLKFSNAQIYGNRSNNSAPVQIRARPQNSANKENDDDDVIIINSDGPVAKPAIMEPPPLVKLPTAESSKTKSNSRPYLKVRSVSQLLAVSSECITIPDDPPGQSDDVIPVEEKDPLAIVDEVPAAASSSSSGSKEKVKSVESMDTTPEDAVKVKNVQSESRIDELVKGNIKYHVPDIPEDELKRMLGVRVLLATNLNQKLPENRLKLGSDDSKSVVDAEEANENELMNVDDDDKVEENQTSDIADKIKEKDPEVSPMNLDETESDKEKSTEKEKTISTEEKENGTIAAEEEEEDDNGKKNKNISDNEEEKEEDDGKKNKNISDEAAETEGGKKNGNISDEDEKDDESNSENVSDKDGEKEDESKSGNVSDKDDGNKSGNVSDENEEKADGNKSASVSDKDENKSGNVSDEEEEEEDKEDGKKSGNISDEDEEKEVEKKNGNVSDDDKESSTGENEIASDLSENEETKTNEDNVVDSVNINEGEEEEEEEEETNLTEENPLEGTSANEEEEDECNSTEENADSTPANEDTSVTEENGEVATKTSKTEVSKNEAFSTEQMTTDSGIEVDSK